MLFRSKLPSYNFIVYRGVRRTTARLKKYQNALESRTILTEHAFMSTSKSRSIALQYGRILFRIFSKNGKLVEIFSKFGINSATNEQEVLFMSNSKFAVLNVEDINNYVEITLQEI